MADTTRRVPSEDPGRPLTWTERYESSATDEASRRELWSGFDMGWVMVSELLGATFTWGGVGWLADRWLGTAPLLLSLGFVLGFSTGFYLLWARSTGRITPRPARGDTASRPVTGNDR